MGSDGRVRLGVVATAHGLRGEVLIHPYNQATTLPVRGMSVFLEGPDGRTTTARVTAVRSSARGRLVLFEGVQDRTAAEALRGRFVWVLRSDMPPLGPDEFYWEDVIGSSAHGPDGRVIGRVRDIFRSGTDVLAIDLDDGDELLVPVVEGYVLEIGADGVVLGDEALAAEYADGEPDADEELSD